MEKLATVFGHMDKMDSLDGGNSNQYWVLKINLKDLSSEQGEKSINSKCFGFISMQSIETS